MLSFLFICEEYKKYTAHKKKMNHAFKKLTVVRAQNVYT